MISTQAKAVLNAAGWAALVGGVAYGLYLASMQPGWGEVWPPGVILLIFLAVCFVACELLIPKAPSE